MVCSLIATSQVTSITVETVFEDDGSVAGYPEGNKTYRIYAHLTHITDRLTAVYGDNNSPLYLKVSGNGIWNSSLGGATAYDNDCDEHTENPSLEYDSFLTIGYLCNAGNENEIIAEDDPNVDTWIEEAFNTSPYGIDDIAVNTAVGGLWAGLHSDPNTQADEELRVLIAQITTDGEICGSFNFQVFPEYAGIGSPYIEQSGFYFGSLENNSISITTEVSPLQCHGGNNASIEVDATGGVGSLSYSFDGQDFDSETTFDNLNSGDYTVFVKDETGCIAVESVSIEDPEAITATWQFSGLTCHDSNDGSIVIDHTGGVGMLIFSIDGENYMPSPIFENLSAGVYQVSIMDMNYCTFESDEEIVLTNPDEITANFEQFDILCHGDNNGRIEVAVEGGVPPYMFNFGQGYESESTVNNLPSGFYQIDIMDANGCVYTIPEIALIGEPTAIEVEGLNAIPITESTPGGNTPFTVSGGVFPYEFEWTDEEGNIVSYSENLPQLFGQIAAGTYTLTITDEVGCILVEELVISYLTGIDELNNSLSFEIYPNPTNGIFTLELTTAGSYHADYSVKDSAGRMILSRQLNISAPGVKEDVDIASLAPGIYFFEMKTERYSKTVRIIKI